VGSSTSLGRRLSTYYCLKGLELRPNIYIHRAILKYTLSSFKLSILEYCLKENTLIREECYLRLLKPEYNVSTTPSASFLGLTHSEIARSKIGSSKLGNTYGEALKGRVRSAETKKKI